MIRALQISLLMQMLISGAQRGPAEYVRIERISDRVLLAYWVGTGRCNITAIQSEKGLVVVDTEMSPRIMARSRRGLRSSSVAATGRTSSIHTHTYTTPAAIGWTMWSTLG